MEIKFPITKHDYCSEPSLHFHAFFSNFSPNIKLLHCFSLSNNAPHLNNLADILWYIIAGSTEKLQAFMNHSTSLILSRIYNFSMALFTSSRTHMGRIIPSLSSSSIKVQAWCSNCFRSVWSITRFIDSSVISCTLLKFLQCELMYTQVASAFRIYTCLMTDWKSWARQFSLHYGGLRGFSYIIPIPAQVVI